MAVDMSQFYEVFFDEAEELLAEAEHLLLNVSIETPDNEELNAIFRAAHSIKGGAATFGFSDMTEITHVLENLLDKIRKHELALTAEHVDAFLAAKDVLVMEVAGHRNGAVVDQEQVSDVKMMLQSLSDASNQVAPANIAASVASITKDVLKENIADAPKITKATAPTIAPTGKASNAQQNIGFKITLPEISQKDIDNLQAELALLGDISLQAPENNQVVLHLIGDSSQDDIISICSFVLDPDLLMITPLSSNALEPTIYIVDTVAETIAIKSHESNAPQKAKIDIEGEVGYGLFAEEGQAEVEEGYGFFAPFTPHPDAPIVAMIDDQTALAAKTAISNTNSHSLTTEDNVNTDSTTKKATTKKETDKNVVAAETSSIRVGIEKVDQLINLVGELVITQAMIEQRVGKLDPIINEDLINSIGQLTRNTRDLQESVMSIRMMPMDFVFSRFPRMVRDLASKLGKKVELVTIGSTTELDKGLIERIVDPLTHLVRNSVDHGVEMPSARKEKGKEDIGRITLSAAHKGGSIVIEVTDDGAGLNREKLLTKARANGISVSDNMPDSEVYNLIFAPGFSTAEVVTDVSGRGVGMDVVKRNISAMGGVVDIRSALGYGTTISIALPLTLAILDGMSVSLGQSVYVIPLNLIVETLQPRVEDIKTITGEGQVVYVRGEYLPIIALHRLFNHHTNVTDPTKGVLVLIESDGKKSALFIDRLVGQQQVVIKSLETNYRKILGVSGATIMGDGSVALILDVPAIIQMGQSFNYMTGAPVFTNDINQHKANLQSLALTNTKEFSV